MTDLKRRTWTRAVGAASIAALIAALIAHAFVADRALASDRPTLERFADDSAAVLRYVPRIAEALDSSVPSGGAWNGVSVRAASNPCQDISVLQVKLRISVLMFHILRDRLAAEAPSHVALQTAQYSELEKLSDRLSAHCRDGALSRDLDASRALADLIALDGHQLAMLQAQSPARATALAASAARDRAYMSALGARSRQVEFAERRP